MKGLNKLSSGGIFYEYAEQIKYNVTLNAINESGMLTKQTFQTTVFANGADEAEQKAIFKARNSRWASYYSYKLKSISWNGRENAV